jgi:hypothetical protein
MPLAVFIFPSLGFSTCSMLAPKLWSKIKPRQKPAEVTSNAQEILAVKSSAVAHMARFLIWMDETQDKAWSCSNCGWRFPLPTLLQDEEAKKAYDRLAALKFKEHVCEEISSPWQATGPFRDPTFADRARALVARGYKPKDAVALVLEEMALESRNNPKFMAEAKAEGEKFLLKIRQGRI